MHMKTSDDKVGTARADQAGVQTRFICQKPLMSLLESYIVFLELYFQWTLVFYEDQIHNL